MLQRSGLGPGQKRLATIQAFPCSTGKRGQDVGQ